MCSRIILQSLLFAFLLTGCDINALNSPYPAKSADDSVLFTSFSLRPKHLDPARSYSSNEIAITGQVYEPPFQYHFLKRPYELIPLTAVSLPQVQYLDSNHQPITDAEIGSEVAYSVYQINIKPGVYYQPHPAFVQNEQGDYLYHTLDESALSAVKTLSDFEQTATRELQARDYVNQIKRLAHPEIHSPILGLMSEYIVGLADFAKKLQQLKQSGQAIELNDYEIEGVSVLDDYTYEIRVYGRYPQLKYWLAMPFFAPIPWEADTFYNQAGLVKKNITLDWYPIGTGPYQLIENDPNRRMVLERNPNFHQERYPTEGEASDEASGLLADAGNPMPFIDRIVFTLEKENTSYWGKFVQGYYDVSGISSDSFEQAIQVSSSGEFGLSESMEEKGIQLKTAVGTSIFYIGFNMLDPVIGGYDEKARKLRQAISIAIDHEEYISIFANGRGIPAQGPIPPGIFGHVDGNDGLNPYVYDWRDNLAKRKSLEYARQLMVEAGYPQGRHAKTGEPLLLYYDVPASGPDSKAQLDWLRKQFQKLKIQLVIRSTDYNRFQDKIRRGRAQIFQWGWNADYPDPENFLFLLYGPNGKVESGGENAANYHNEQFDKLFEQMRVMSDGPQRQQLIQQMLDVVRADAPWVWGFHPKDFTLFHVWNKNVKPHLMANNTLKYRRIDADLRSDLQQQWNQPVLWPFLLIVVLFLVLLVPAVMMYRYKKNNKPQINALD